MGDNEGDVTSTIQTGLGPLRVRVLGSGPPAVLWHSLFVDSTTWARVRDPLARQRRVVLIDGPSHGGSEPTNRGFTLEECAGAACDVLDHLGMTEPVDWVGNAWGGHVGIAFADSCPERCRSLVTIGAPVRALTPAERRRSVALLAAYRITGPIPPLAKALCDALLGPAADPQATRLVTDAFRHANRRGMATAMRSISLRRPDLTPALARITAPTLIVTGADDAMWPPREARTSAALLPQGGYITLPGAGHIAPLLQAASQVVTLLTDFWRDPAESLHNIHTQQRPAPKPPTN